MEKIFDKDVLNEQLIHFLGECKFEELSENTLKKYNDNLKVFIKDITNKPIHKDTIIDFKNSLDTEKEFKVKTQNSYIVAINKFLKFIGYGDFIVKQAKEQQSYSLEEFINYTDYHRLLRTAIRKNDTRAWLLMRVLGETGIRVSELVYFELEKLDRSMKIKSKGKTRDIIIKIDLLASLRKYAKENKIYSGPIFPGRNPKKTMHDSNVRKILKEIAGQSRVLLEKVHPHSFRHYFAKCYLDEHPEDWIGLADLLGHTSIETVRLYGRLSSKEKERKLRKIKF